MKKVTEFIAAAAGAVVSFFCGLPPLMWVLLAVMSIDFLTGVTCAWMGRSKKTMTGGISSGTAFQGLLKKGLIILVVLLAALLDKVVSMSAGVTFDAVSGATCLWFIASEGFSILENVASMGVPIPKILMQALEIMRSKGDVPSKQAAEAKEEKKTEKEQEKEYPEGQPEGNETADDIQPEEWKPPEQ